MGQKVELRPARDCYFDNPAPIIESYRIPIYVFQGQTYLSVHSVTAALFRRTLLIDEED
jgi:hypothetical protein